MTASPAQAPSPLAVRTRHKVVLVHGVLGFTRRTISRLFSFAYFQGVEDALLDAGIDVVSVALPATASVEARAQALAQAIERTGEGPVNLIAHSMGGLDARWYVGKLGGHARVASLVTISTPHRGTHVADWGEARLGRALAGWRLLRDVGIDPGRRPDTLSIEEFVRLAQAMHG